jgi:adenylyltransferase/sulfurtransferase
MTGSLSPDELVRYSRNILLPQVGVEGQQKLKNASVLIVGLGGLGSPVALYLAAAGVGHIGLADPDRVDLSNLQRQVLHTTTGIGQQKSSSAREHLHELNPDILLDAIPEAITVKNALRILGAYEVVVDATDNQASRYLLNDACYLTNIPLVHGSVYQFEGQVCVFDGHQGACYRCAFPTPSLPEHLQNNSKSGVLGVLPGLIGMLQATEVMKLILGLGTAFPGSILIYDAMQTTFRKVHLVKNKSCPLCGNNPSITRLLEAEYEKIGKFTEV